MDQLPWVSPEKLNETLRGLEDELAERIMQSMTAVKAGQLIDGTEEPVRTAGHGKQPPDGQTDQFLPKSPLRPCGRVPWMAEPECQAVGNRVHTAL